GLFLLKATGVLLLTGGMALLLHRSSAGTRHAVWLAALALVLVLPLLSVAIPRWQILPIAERLREVSEVALSDPGPAGPAASASGAEPSIASRGATEETDAAHVPAERPSAAALALAFWVCGTLLLLG